MTAQPDAADDVVRLRGVEVVLGGRRVLHDVGVSVGAGQLTGLIGANGAGKTTLLRVILGLQPTAAGEVRTGRQADRRRGRAIGYVPQRVALDPDVPLRARDLVGLGIDGHRFGVGRPTAARRERIDRMLAAVDATRFADARVGRLSGGEQQRVLIAHALIGQPDVLLLDEPLANLDIRAGHEIVDLLARLARQRRVAVLITAHDMNPLLPVMDRIVYLAGGRAVAGPVDEVVRTDVLSRLYGYPVEVVRARGRILVVGGRSDDPALPDEHHAAPVPGTPLSGGEAR